MSSESFNIIDELIEAFPEASSDDLYNALVEHLEASLPEILRSLELPPIPSPAELAQRKGESLRMKRRRGREKFRLERAYNEYDTFISELFSIKRQLDGFHDSCTSSEYTISNGDADRARPRGYFAGYQDGLTYLRRFPKIETEQEALFKSPEVEPPLGSFQPYLPISGVKEEPLAPQVTIDIPTQQRIIADRLFADVARTMEVKLVEFAMKTGKVSKYDLVTQADVEIPEWKRVVIKIASKEATFDEKIRLWDELDAIVRGSLNDLKQYSPQDTEALESINENLFLHMELV